MDGVKSRLNATVSAANFANIINSCKSNVRQVNILLVLKRAQHMSFDGYYNDLLNNERDCKKETEIKIGINGEIYINGKLLDPKNPPSGYKVFIDRKESSGK
ncbi:MAG: hypothetical protein HPY74_09490 [Firmicutes bacterium]|nr:hypothetical protein [Bacillota bacterium]